MLLHISFHFIAFAISGTGTGYKDQIEGSVPIGVQVRESRSDNSAAAIAADCFADLFWGGDTYSKVMIFSFDRIGNESGRYKGSASAVDTLKIPVALDRSNFHLTTDDVENIIFCPFGDLKSQKS